MVPGSLLGAGSGPVPRLPGRAGEGRDQHRPDRGRRADHRLLASDHLPPARRRTAGAEGAPLRLRLLRERAEPVPGRITDRVHALLVSFTNSAVDNVREKLDEAGFGHVLANLGSREKQRGFFADQQERNARVQAFAAHVPPPPEPEALGDVDERLRGLQADERARAELRSELSAHELELQHFEQHLRGSELPELERLPLLGRPSARILDYLAESELEQLGAQPGVIRRIWKYFRYGSLRGLDPGDTDVVLRSQRAYYDKRIAELRADIARLDAKLARADFEGLAEEHRELSLRFLRARLGERYRSRSRTTHQAEKYRMSRDFKDFLRDYPAVLSTCHSLHTSLADGHLLDYLIIDEASQVHPLLAGLAMACCRNLVVVGDQHQLPPIPPEPAKELAAPEPAHHCGERSVLTSLMEIYGDELPRTLLREHYRCQPPIIGFCNKKFYGGELITYTGQHVRRPMTVVRTAEGNHMREHAEGGRSNRREIDGVEQEVIPRYCGGVAGSDIGITTPYRRQANKAGDALDVAGSATVHKFQGRQKKVVIMSTVLDETWRGRTGLTFVDQRNLINVAVSRAVERFVLVTNNAMMPTSRHIKDLVGHIRYQNPDGEVVDSAVISVFDLLYSRYSDRLRALADRIRPVTDHRSEDIAWTVLHDVLAEAPYAHLTVVTQVLLKNLFPETADLTDRQRQYVERRASVDFVLYNRVTNEPVLAVEVDGFAFHENEPAQRERDETKDQIFRTRRLPLLRLPTTGSGEPDRIRAALDAAESG
ncbi:DUF2726 domain-containing protein [Saccharopolyspora karakumensis]|uniref:DUF2726 domain-containing protein n=1 Tax=Saccharopolyspora karakumensis TaxID=2530386 RepID=A0A4R5BXC1_9PSEU|nr:DUF2726 domain-containing protein [Saccharopolyspora karakumensis]